MPAAYIIKAAELPADLGCFVRVQKCHKSDVASVSPSISAEASLSGAAKLTAWSTTRIFLSARALSHADSTSFPSFLGLGFLN